VVGLHHINFTAKGAPWGEALTGLTARDWDVDHKADPRSVGHDDRLAQAHGLQLEAYSQALLAATGRPVRERWLYLPVAGQAVRIVVARADGSVAVT